MPLLNKKPFRKCKPPADLQPDEEIFFCEPTREVFRNYDDFFERMILCNSLLWSCEITGKTGLTYLEADESERVARRHINNIPIELKKALLLLCTLMRKTGIKDLVSEVLGYIRERFFLGEVVQILQKNSWTDACVRGISLTGGGMTNGHSATSNNGASPSASSPAGGSSPVGQFGGVRTDRVRYKLQLLPDGAMLSAASHQLRRDRRLIGGDRLRMLYRQATRHDERGLLVLRVSLVRRFGLDRMTFGDMFVGPQPQFPAGKLLPLLKAKPSPKPSVVGAGKAKPSPPPAAGSKAKPAHAGDRNSPLVAKSQPVFDKQDEAPLSLVRSDLKQQWEAERKRMADVRLQERDRRRQRKKQLVDWLKDWGRVREDLLCEDHKELPVLRPVGCRVPSQLFGECLSVLEFVTNFSSLLDVTDTMPAGLSLPVLESALIESDLAGPYVQLLQMLLRAIFSLQSDEDDETGRAAAAADSEQDLTAPSVALLDTHTVSEVLRRHLARGFSTDDTAVSRWRFQQRGGYTDADCPTYRFRREFPHIMDKLAEDHVLSLSTSDRLAVLDCLISEILISVSARDVIEEADTKQRDVRVQLKSVRASIAALQRSLLADDKQHEKREEALQRSAAAAAALSGGVLDVTVPVLSSVDEPTISSNDAVVNGAADSSAGPPSLEPAATATVVESAAEREQRRREVDKQLAELQRREQKLQKQLWEAARQCVLTPLGRDRAYRRYWLLSSPPALLVESVATDGCSGSCLPRPSVHCPRLAALEGGPTAAAAELRLMLTERLREQLQLQASAAAAVGGGSVPAPPLRTYSKNTTSADAASTGGSTMAARQVNGTADLSQPPELQSSSTAVAQPASLSEHPDPVSIKPDTAAVKSESAAVEPEPAAVKSESAAVEPEPAAVKPESAAVKPDPTAAVQPPPAAAGTTNGAFPQIGLDELLNRDVDVTAALDRLTDSDASSDTLRRLLLCTADGDSCPVHSSDQPSVVWSFCPDTQQLDRLLAALNSRGAREADLRTNLLQSESLVRRAVERCPRRQLQLNAEELRRAEADSSASATHAGLQIPVDSSVHTAEELVLRDLIMELEEKTRFGALGYLKVEDREAWRDALLQRSYDRQCDQISWGVSNQTLEDPTTCPEDPLDVAGPSTASQPFPSSSCITSTRYLSSEHGEVVRSLASAILQLEQGIDRKFLRPPLASDDVAVVLRWEDSLMASSSLSQLCVHLSQLESSIQWSRSILNTRCKLCRRKSDPENMLLCDGCDKGFHMYCLTPKLKTVPKDDWFCATCRPKEKPKSPRKQRRAFSERSDDEASGEDDGGDGGDDEAASEDDRTIEEENSVDSEDAMSESSRQSSSSASDDDDEDFEDQPEEDVTTAAAKRGLKRPAATTKSSTKRSSNGAAAKRPKVSTASKNKKRRATVEGRMGENGFDYAVLTDLLSELKRHPGGEHFLRPVKAKEAPHYYTVIREPMDLGTIQKKLNTSVYSSNQQVLADAALVFANCCMYNEKGSYIHTHALKLRRFFNRRSLELGLRESSSAKRVRRSI